MTDSRGFFALATAQLTAVWMILLAGLPAASAAPALPQHCEWLPGPQAAVQMPTEVLDPNPDAVRIAFYNPPLEFSTVDYEDGTYQTVRLPGEGAIHNPGAPELPKVARLLMIGNRGNVELSVTRSSFHIVPLQGNIAPAQYMEGDLGEPTVPYAAPDETIYKSDAWYPAKIAHISEPATLRDVRFVAATVYPVQVNPVRGEMRIYDEIEIEVVNTGGTGSNEILIQPTSVDPGFKRLYESFENFRGSHLDDLPVVPGDYLVICRDYVTIRAEAQKLVDWHKRRGNGADYIALTSGQNNIGTIRTLIQNRYTASNGRLAYVSILGDPASGTADSFRVVTATSPEQYDNYYGTGVVNPNGPDNPDPVPDIAIGRISAVSLTQLRSVVKKTIEYETDPYLADTGWPTRAWCASHTNYAASNPSFKRYTYEIMSQHGISPVYWNVYSSTTTLQSDIETRLSAGISVFNHRMSWISEVDLSHLNLVPVNRMWPFVMAITCGSGNFASSEGFSERWVMPLNQDTAHLKGAIGCVGMQGSGTHTRFNNALDAGAMYGLYVMGVHEQGTILIAAKLQLYRNYWDDDPTNTANFCYWANLIGDPAVPVWTKRPYPALVTKPSTVNAGTNHVRLRVRNAVNFNPVPDAFVCLYRSGVSLARGFTDGSGLIDLPCTTSTPGYLHITITKDDLAAYLDSIQIVSSSAWLALDSASLDDDNVGGTHGDGNRALSPGDSAALSIRLRNVGTSQTISSINATLTCASPGIQITGATSSYPNLVPGATGVPNSPFRVVVTSVYHNTPVTFFLLLTSSAAPETLRVDLTARAPDVRYVRSRFTGPGGNIDPGENGDLIVTFKNTGSLPLYGARGLLRSLDPYIEVTDSTGDFGDVDSAAVDSSNIDRFHINISGGAFPGHRAVMQLVVTDDKGFRDSTVFDSTNFWATDPGLMNRDSSNFLLTIGTRDTLAPSGPDGYGYYAYDNSETQPPFSNSTFEWVEIAPFLGGAGTSLNFNDSAEDYDSSRTITLPFTFRFYGQTFSEITICSNGWIAFGSYLIDDARNYRMGTPPGPPNQVAAYWDDLQTYGTYNNCWYRHDAANFRFIVEWRSKLLWESTHDLEKFQIILYDPAHYPSLSGDGKIKVQYDTVAVKRNYESATNDYCSVGIQNADHSIGLDYYYWNTYSSGSSPIRNGRSIMFTTDAGGQLGSRLLVTQPNGGESWYIGQSHNLLWQSAAVPGPVKIELKRNFPSGTWEVLWDSVANDGVQPWTVSAPAVSGTARIRITSVRDPLVSDTSNAGFSIVMPTVQLYVPNGGDTLLTGTHCYPSWTSEGLGSVRVELNRSYPSGSWEVIRESVTGFFDWMVTGPPTSQARMRVMGISVPTVGDTSDADFVIGRPPIISHDPKADQSIGPALFVATITDDAPGFAAKLFHRISGGGSYDSTQFSATGNPNEYSATTASLAAGRYEYFLRVSDPQGFVTYWPSDSTKSLFDVGPLAASWISYDDGTAENYNWVNGPDFQWAVRFDAPSYPYALCGGRFAICPTVPSTTHQPILFRVILADGPSGAPGTVVFSDTTACAGNVVGGLPSGAAWAEVVTRSGGQPLQLNGPFYLSVQNPEIRMNPVAFAHDTAGARNHRSWIYDGCESEWLNEDEVAEVTRPGNRMIRANGFSLAPLSIVVTRSDSAGVSSALLTWTSNGAPYYRIYSASAVGGPFSTLEGSIAGPPAGQVVQFRDVNAIGESVRRFYRVHASDQP